MPNSEWTIKPNSATTTKRAFTFDFLDASSSQDEIDFTITISREHLFPFLNIVLPVVTLSLAHLLVFLLPVESGERTSFSFTLLLTLVVFMTMVSDRLPASNNISGFNSFLLSQLISSILTTALVVFSIRLFYKDSNIAQLKIFYRVILFLYGLSCQCYIQRKKVKDSKTEDVHKRHERPSWKKVSLFFDRLCAWFLCVVYGTQLCIYGIIVISG
jgi:nicotinic acetylcholine receptor alpha-9/nicotinic acetylcholine receptor alpha-10